MNKRKIFVVGMLVSFGLGGCVESLGSEDEDASNDSHAVTGTNLLTNPGFEDGTASPWEQWGAISVKSNGIAHSGTYAAEVATSNGGGQMFTATPGATYTYSAWGSAAGGGGDALLVLKFFDSALNQLGSELTSSPFSAGYAQEAIVSTAPANAVWIQIGFWNSSDGALNLDDFSLTDGSSGTPTGNNLLVNGDFENNSIEGWDQWGTFWVSGSQDANNGAHAALVPSSNGGGQFVDVTVGARYTFSAWGKASGNGGNAVIIFKFFNAAYQKVGPELVSDAFGSSYGQQSLEATAPAGATMLQVGFYNSSNANLYIDDMTVTMGSGGTDTGTGTGTGTGSCPSTPPPGPVAVNLASGPVDVPDNFVGMHVAIADANNGNSVAAPVYSYGYVRSLKVSTGKNLTEQGFWQNIEYAPSGEGQPGNFDWTQTDKWVAANAGHPIIWLIYGTPTFYQKYGDTNDDFWGGNLPRGMHNPPRDDKHYALKRYAKAVKARYGSQIAAFEVWNEPTLSYGDAGNFTKRCDPSITSAQICPVQRFFSGSAIDLANIAYTLNQAGLGVPVLGAGFVDQWGTGQHSVSRFLDAPVSLPGGSGKGKDHIQGLSVHFYDYGYNPTQVVDHITGYRAKLESSGVGHLPLWISESGAAGGADFVVNDSRAPTNIKRWTMISAAMGVQSHVLYTHAEPGDAIRTLSDPVNNPAVQSAVNQSFALGGQTICDGRILQDGRVWLLTTNGEILE